MEYRPIGSVPFGELTRVAEIRLVLLVLTTIAFAPFSAVIVDEVIVSVPVLRLLIAGAVAPPLIVQLVKFITPVLLLPTPTLYQLPLPELIVQVLKLQVAVALLNKTPNAKCAEPFAIFPLPEIVQVFKFIVPAPEAKTPHPV